MHILHAYKIYRPDIEGGVPAVISSLAGDANDHISHSVLCARRRGFASRYQIDAVPVHAVASLGTLASTPLAPAYIPILIQKMRTSDLVIHHAPLPLNDMAILLGLPEHVGLIVYWHAEIIGHMQLKRLVSPLMHRVLARADKIVVSGQSIIDASPFVRNHATKCVVIPYGMDLDYWRKLEPNEVTIVEEMRRSKPRHIVTLGRLVSYKGYDILIRAMQNIDGYATIIGEGALLNELQKLALETGVADRVRFAGRLSRNNIRRLFHSADVFAFPSVTNAEAFGIAQVEAMAAGLPVVNTSLLTTVPSVARHEREGLTVPPGDPVALCQALNRILDDPASARQLGLNGRERAHKEFGQELFRRRMGTVYSDALLGRKKNGSLLR